MEGKECSRWGNSLSDGLESGISPACLDKSMKLSMPGGEDQAARLTGSSS